MSSDNVQNKFLLFLIHLGVRLQFRGQSNFNCRVIFKVSLKLSKLPKNSKMIKTKITINPNKTITRPHQSNPQGTVTKFK
jgi:hypothetical protein